MQEENEAIPLDLLPALEALLSHGSVTRAAEAIGLSQPAMSRILGRLRRSLSDPLLVRSGQRWTLTPRAERLIGPVSNLLREAERVWSDAAFDPATAHHHFLVALPDVVSAVVLPTLVDRLSSLAPSCRLSLIPWPASPTSRDDLDAAVTTETSFFPGFRQDPLFRDEDVLTFRATEEPRNSEDRFARPHVAVIPRGFSHDIVDGWLKERGVSRTIGLTVPTYLQALHVVAATDLVAVLPKRLVQRVGGGLGLAYETLGIEQEQDRYWLLHPPRLTAEPASAWFRRQLKEILR